MIKIEFDKVTWYTKMISIVLFLGLVPILVFRIGSLYGSYTAESVETLRSVEIAQAVETRVKRSDSSFASCNKEAKQINKDQCVDKVLQKVKNKLDEVYGAIEIDPKFTGILKESIMDSQEKWLFYVYSECKAQGLNYEGGNLETFVVSTCKIDLFEERIKTLENWTEMFKL